MTRRGVLRWLGRLGLAGLAASVYGIAIEPRFFLRVQRYAFTPPRWTPGLKLRLTMLADPHVIYPHMSPARWGRIIQTANALAPDMHLLLGDFRASHRFATGHASFEEVAHEAKALTSPLGTFGVCGNHDWWQDAEVQRAKAGQTRAIKVFEDAGIPMLENRAIRLTKDGVPFWLSGTSSMVAMFHSRASFSGADDLPGTLAQITDDAPVIHLAHEPDQFVNIPERVSLTLSGHTHGGQVRVLGYAPIVPSQYGNRFVRGHIVEDGRHLVVSSGLGCSGFPIRIGSPPEITLLDLG